MDTQGRCSVCDDFTDVHYDSASDAYVCDLCLMDSDDPWEIDWGDLFQQLNALNERPESPARSRTRESLRDCLHKGGRVLGPGYVEDGDSIRVRLSEGGRLV